MKNIKIIMLIMGFAAISACASNDAMDAAESDAEAKAEMMKEEQSAAMDEKKTEAEADIEAMKTETEADMKESADAMVEQAEAEVETAVAQASGNLVSTCKNGGEVRVISVVYDNEESDAVCEVTYEKSTGVQTLWSAQNDRDYCLDKATEFVKKQEGWGWTCSNLE